MCFAMLLKCLQLHLKKRTGVKNTNAILKAYREREARPTMWLTRITRASQDKRHSRIRPLITKEKQIMRLKNGEENERFIFDFKHKKDVE